ncbi:MAG: hypothetical protein ACREH3_04290, partial [Geminicoccales bacterium]
SGRHFASRVSQSLLTAIGLPQLICRDLEAYADLAVEVGRTPATLQAHKAEVAAKRHTSPLFDTAAFARDLEAAYHEMWKVFRSGQPPRRIDVPGRAEP